MSVEEHIAELLKAQVSIDAIISAYGRHHASGLQEYVEGVRYSDDLERAGGDVGMVSEGADPGAWVLAWVWVTDAEAGVERDAEDDADDED
jgi:hypothetical protein